MANALVLNHSDPDAIHGEVIGYKVEVNGEPVWVLAPHGGYTVIAKSVRDALDEAFPGDDNTFKLVQSSMYVRRTERSDYHMDLKVRVAVDKDAFVVRNGRKYRLVEVE